MLLLLLLLVRVLRRFVRLEVEGREDVLALCVMVSDFLADGNVARLIRPRAILQRCVNNRVQEAQVFVNVNVLLLMATSFALGLAVEESGLAATLAMS